MIGLFQPLRPGAFFISLLSQLIGMKIIYNIGIFLYSLFARILSPFSRKAYLWTKGRIGWYTKLKEQVDPSAKYIWVHCASLGEFEQGRPVIEAIKKVKPQYKIVLTFFSPSGYEIRKNYKYADIVSYLPPDTRRNAKRFVELIRPEKVIFVKYEFWHHFISALYNKGISLILISGIFRDNHFFFRWYGRFFRKILEKFTWFYVQDRESEDILARQGFTNVTVAGDSRFDRVMQIAREAKTIPEIELFSKGEKLLLIGSSWPKDEEIITKYINIHPGLMKWVFAPHEPDPANIERLEKMLSVDSIRFSEFREEYSDARVLIIDNVGMLSSAYRYAWMAVVGGGFGKGIHNILEPACWGIPVIFGPRHDKFREAVEMKTNGSGATFSNYREFEMIIDRFMNNNTLYKEACENSLRYVKENAGATKMIIEGLF